MRITTLATYLWLTLLGATALAQGVPCDYDRHANFPAYKTYAWARGAELENPASHLRVVKTIDDALSAKGLRRVEPSANPDVLVAYRATLETILETNEVRGWSPFGATASVHTVLVGTLVVEMTDASANSVVWRGRSTSEFRPDVKPDKRDKTMAKSAKKMFEHYPKPKPGTPCQLTSGHEATRKSQVRPPYRAVRSSADQQ